MNRILQKSINSCIPFIFLGICFAFCIGLLVLFSYFILWGFFIGVILWIGASIKEYFFPSRTFIKLKRRIIPYKDEDL